MTRAGHKRSGRRAGPHRTCIGCRQLRPQQQLLRVVADEHGQIWPDLFGRLPGRGAHLCPDFRCLLKATERKAFGRVFRRPIREVDASALADSFESQAKKQALAILVAALRSGFVQAGRDRVAQLIQDAKPPLVLVAEDASAATKQWASRLAEGSGVPWRCALDKAELSNLHKGKPLAILALCHRGMAERLKQELDSLRSLQTSRLAGKADGKESVGNSRQGLTQRSLRGKMPRT